MLKVDQNQRTLILPPPALNAQNTMGIMLEKQAERPEKGSVRTKVKGSNNRNADIRYARMLLNSTNLNHNMYKISLVPNCECSFDRETIEHHQLKSLKLKERK